MIVVFGSINADLIFPVAALPVAGQTLLADGLTMEPGGKGANQAVAASRDGAAVVMVGSVGTDALAAIALQGLEEAGVDLRRVAVATQPTGCASICTDPEGRNHIVLAPGANCATPATAVEDALLGPGMVLVTQMEADPAETAALIRRAHTLGARTIHNLAPAGALAGDALRLLDILVVNEDEAAWLARQQDASGDASGLHAALGVTVVRTLGGGGAEWSGRDGSGRVPAAAVRPVDTTAAGDCFVGVLAASLHRGSTLQEAVHRANAAAGLACTRAGSQRSLPHAMEITRAAAPGVGPSPGAREGSRR